MAGPADAKQLAALVSEGEVLTQLDLSGRDFRGAKLSGGVFEGVDFRGAQLAGAEGQHQRLRAVQGRRQGALPAVAGKVRGGGGLHRVSIRARWPGTGLPTPAYRQADRRA